MSAMGYLIDTNMLVYAYQDKGGCRQRLEAQAAHGLHICPLTVFEIEFGIAKSTRPKALRLFLDDVLARYTFAPFTAPAASQAGQLRAQLERKGPPIGPYDLLIAGIALAHDLTVVTRNVREFLRVPGLQVENWFDEQISAVAHTK